MDKKELSVTLIFAGVTLLFALASFALFLSRGKSKFWTAKKMKFGAVLLTITAATSLQSCEEEEQMCYATAELNNWINIENYEENLDLKQSNEIKGKIEYRSSDVYSFILKNDAVDTIFQKEELTASDGMFNDSVETFKISLDTNLVSGNYTLSFYDEPVVQNDSVFKKSYSIADYHFKIKND